MQKVLFIFGTRPEGIKFAPLIKEMQRYPKEFSVKVCVTGQHKEMLQQVLDFFRIEPDYNLNIMEPNQSLFTVSSKIIKGIEPILESEKPDLVFVQGDTTTVLMGALGAFYDRIPVAHLEAGLRTGDMGSPFPEEMNRVLVSRIAAYHFTPTDQSTDNLLRDNIDHSKIYNVGNTVIDALNLATELIQVDDSIYRRDFSGIDFTKKIVLVTSHRRENSGEGFDNICSAVKEIAANNEIEVVFPIHYNPGIRNAAKKCGLYTIENIKMIDPLDYPHLVYMMNKSYIILTDSGGIQEEAPSLGKPVLVLRTTTERPEGVQVGVAKLIGTNKDKIVTETEILLTDQVEYTRMANATNPYGDGQTSKRIIDILRSIFSSAKQMHED